MSFELEPLRQLLENLQRRLVAVESHVGLAAIQADPEKAAATHLRAASSSSLAPELQQENETQLPASVTAFDHIIASSVTPLLSSLQQLNLSELTTPLSDIYKTQRGIILMAASCKKPTGNTIPEALKTHIEPIQVAVKNISNTVLSDKKYHKQPWDLYGKAIQELLVGVSWIVMQAPPAPTTHVKETLSSTEFWTNKIRKEFKPLLISNQTDENTQSMAKHHIAFCDAIKTLILDLAAYVKEFHLSGLCWNPHGKELKDYSIPNKNKQTNQTNHPEAIVASSSNVITTTATTKTTTTTTTITAAEAQCTPATATATATANTKNWIQELEAKQTQDGNSAATGLRKVTKEQQTWRKEYIAPSSTVSATKMKFESPNGSTESRKSLPDSCSAGPPLPICEYQTQGNKWIIENQTAQNNPNGIRTIQVQDPKSQVYIFSCHQVTISIQGKVKGIIIDSSTKTNVIFESTISTCETVNCNKVQIQCTGTCPTFSIDKTDGCLIFLSKESLTISRFITSKSSEMNVGWEDEVSGEQKECPIPEQFCHSWNHGAITSTVSDIYH